MRILYAKTFGIGNATMSVPALKALKALGHEVDVLVGSTPDDTGAFEVMAPLVDRDIISSVGRVCDREREYDLAILSIPYDGRWVNGLHFRARQVVDGRTRPDPSTTGLVSWKKHEIEYQMDNVLGLGDCVFRWGIPDCSFLPKRAPDPHEKIYLGVGYKKDAAGFWKVKHWGNENYATLISRLLRDLPGVQIVSTGDIQDIQGSLSKIWLEVKQRAGGHVRKFSFSCVSLEESFKVVQSCGMYIGNDTGMMHVAASCDRKVAVVFNLENSIVKSRPWCRQYRCLDGSKTPVTVDQFYQAIMELRDA